MKKDDGGDTLQTTAAWEKSLKLTYVKFALYPLKQHTQRQQGFRSNNQKQLSVFAKKMMKIETMNVHPLVQFLKM